MERYGRLKHLLDRGDEIHDAATGRICQNDVERKSVYSHFQRRSQGQSEEHELTRAQRKLNDFGPASLQA